MKYSVYILLIILVALLLLAVSGAAHVYGAAPLGARATFTPAPEGTRAPLATPMPTPTDAPQAYPAPSDQRPRTKATPAPLRGGLRCGHCP